MKIFNVHFTSGAILQTVANSSIEAVNIATENAGRIFAMWGKVLGSACRVELETKEEV
jgi:hypothetical protein